MFYLGEEQVLKFNYIPANVEIILYKKKKYSCKNKKCQGKDILYEPNTKFALDRIAFTTSFVVYLIIQKFLLSTPIYRLKAILEYKYINVDYNSTLILKFKFKGKFWKNKKIIWHWNDYHL